MLSQKQHIIQLGKCCDALNAYYYIEAINHTHFIDFNTSIKKNEEESKKDLI